MISRRHFLSLIGAAPLTARSYFDIGAAWQRHASGLLSPIVYPLIDDRFAQYQHFLTNYILTSDDQQQWPVWASVFSADGGYDLKGVAPIIYGRFE